MTIGILFAIIGKSPVEALRVYFVDPLTDPYPFFLQQEIIVKATPLVMIAVGLSLCYIANIWNIGAEGPIFGRCGVRQLARGQDQRHRRRPLGTGDDADLRRARRCALRAHTGAVQGLFRRQ